MATTNNHHPETSDNDKPETTTPATTDDSDKAQRRATRQEKKRQKANDKAQRQNDKRQAKQRHNDNKKRQVSDKRQLKLVAAVANHSLVAHLTLVAGLIVVAAVNFTLSFVGLYGFGENDMLLPWILPTFVPIGVDGFSFVGIAAIYLLRHAPWHTKLYCWAVYIIPTAVSVFAQVTHAQQQQLSNTGIVMSSVWALFASLAVHLLVIVARYVDIARLVVASDNPQNDNDKTNDTSDNHNDKPVPANDKPRTTTTIISDTPATIVAGSDNMPATTTSPKNDSDTTTTPVNDNDKQPATVATTETTPVATTDNPSDNSDTATTTEPENLLDRDYVELRARQGATTKEIKDELTDIGRDINTIGPRNIERWAKTERQRNLTDNDTPATTGATT